MSPMPNIKHTLAILTNSLDTMYCQQRKNGENIVKNILPLQFIVFHQQFALIT